MHLNRIASLALAAAVVAAVAPSSNGALDTFFYKGHDLSSLALLEANGYSFADTAQGNETRDAEDILGDGGMNTVRLRLWVDPSDGTYNTQYNIDLATRFQEKGFKIYLDFHFSDYWADPSQQAIPASWPDTLDELVTTIQGYVKDTLVSFHEAGVEPALVALGNEITNGFLWPVGQADAYADDPVASFANLATLWKAARAGVDDAVSAGATLPSVLIHIDNGWDTDLQQSWFSAFTANDVPTTAWDVFGFSFYPFYNTKATFNNLQTTLNALAEVYGKPLQVVETDYPAICDGEYNPIPTSSEPSIPYDVAGQTTWTAGVLSVLEQVPNGLGQGLHYWEPAWLNNTSLGSDCNDAILFDADFTNWPDTVGYSRESVNLFQ